MHVFPLLRLPTDILPIVLKNMEILDRIAYSFISTATKSQIMSLNLKAESISLDVHDSLVFVIKFENDIKLSFDICAHDFNTDVTRGLVMDDVYFVHRGDGGNWTSYKWDNRRGYDVKQWIDHMYSVFHQEKRINLIIDSSSNVFEIDCLKQALKGIKILEMAVFNSVLDDDSNEYVQRVLEEFHPFESLYLENSPYPDHCSLQRLFMRNLKCLTLNETIEYNLNDLLFSNVEIVEIVETETFSQKMCNRFLKLWLTGSNSQLRRLTVFLFDDAEPAEIAVFKGIKYDVVPREGYIRIVGPNIYEEEFRGIFEIKRADRTGLIIEFV